ncbi:MAG: DoxX family protein [Enhygromyxa sp.]
MADNNKGRKIGYWVVTGLLSVAMIGSGVADLLQVEVIAESLARLGYPAHLMTLLGIAKLAAVAVIAAPGLARLKEWAYAGLVIDLGGAVWSHAASGDPIAELAPIFVFLALTFTSYFLRPADRRLPDLPKA